MPTSLYKLDDLMFGIGATSSAPLGGVIAKLANRTDLLAMGGYTWLMDAILELSRNYRFQFLERTGPLVTMQPGVYNYSLDQFLIPSDAGKIANVLPSIFRYFIPYNPVPNVVNPGSELLWRSIDAIELLFNTPGIPAYFTRYGTQILVAPIPQDRYPMFLRYQVEHPFSNPPKGTDPYMLDNDWREIAEYAAAERGAINLRMMDYASQYHTTIFGDPEFERTSGAKGMPGLIFRKITQIETDSQDHMKMLRPVVAPV
jgi:hypothetical protein